MAKKLFSLEAVQAKHGDCLVLHYGTAEDPKFILIDGGPRGNYSRNLQPRLGEIKTKWSPDAPLPLEMVMISHIDDDHIAGVLELANDVAAADAGDALVDIGCLWHNTFDDIIGNDSDDLFSKQTASSAAIAALAEGGGTAMVEGANVERHLAAVIATVPQSRKLRDVAEKLGLTLNEPYRGLVVAPPAGGKKFDWGDGLSLTVLGPTADRIKALHEQWDKEIKKSGDAVTATLALADLDKSPFNLSSIVVLAELGGKTMLLTGDARGDDVIAVLEAAGLMTDGKFKVDLLKLPHHGSERNIPGGFFSTIIAKHYVCSADGNYNNPDRGTLDQLIEERPGKDFKIHMTNHDGMKGKHLKQILDGFMADNEIEIDFPGENERSVCVDLHTKVTY